jgi:hypothetical protein
MEIQQIAPAADQTESILLPPLQSGDRLSRYEFERRYQAMGHLKKAELIEGFECNCLTQRRPGRGIGGVAERAEHHSASGLCRAVGEEIILHYLKIASFGSPEGWKIADCMCGLRLCQTFFSLFPFCRVIF